jgi:glutathione peroxidase
MLKYWLLAILIFVVMNYIFNFITYSTIIGLLGASLGRNAKSTRPELLNAGTQSLYDFKMKALDKDQEIDLSIYRGKKVVILNVASECGFTPQYGDWKDFMNNR